MNDIRFTDNNRPARASVDGNGIPIAASSKPGTPLLGDYLGPEVCGDLGGFGVWGGDPTPR